MQILNQWWPVFLAHNVSQSATMRWFKDTIVLPSDQHLIMLGELSSFNKSPGIPDHVIHQRGNERNTMWVWLRPEINSLWPNSVICQHRICSTLFQVMAWCLMAKSHYLYQCWPFISDDLWHSSHGNFTWKAQDIYPWYEFENDLSKITALSPRGQWVNQVKPVSAARFCDISSAVLKLVPCRWKYIWNLF